MTPPPIIEHLNVLKDIPCRVVTGGIVPMVHERALECPEEAFDTGIIPTVAFAAHARSDALRVEHLLVASSRILTAAIRVVQEPGPWASGDPRQGEGLLGQIHGQPVAPRPANHGARVEVEEHGQIAPACRGSDVGEVPGPHPVGLCHRELAMERGCGHGELMVGRGGGAPRLDGLGPAAVLPHPPCVRIDVVRVFPNLGARDESVPWKCVRNIHTSLKRPS